MRVINVGRKVAIVIIYLNVGLVIRYRDFLQGFISFSVSYICHNNPGVIPMCSRLPAIPSPHSSDQRRGWSKLAINHVWHQPPGAAGAHHDLDIVRCQHQGAGAPQTAAAVLHALRCRTLALTCHKWHWHDWSSHHQAQTQIFFTVSPQIIKNKSNLSVVCSAISKCAKYIETDICQYLNAKYFYKHEVATEQKNVGKSQPGLAGAWKTL